MRKDRLRNPAAASNVGGAALAVHGFTLVELLIVIVILAIVATIAAPNLNALLENRRLAGAADAVLSEIQFARSEAIKQSMDTYVVFAADETEADRWALAIAARRVAGQVHAEACDPWETDPADADACTYEVADSDASLNELLLRRLPGADFRDVDVVLDAGTNAGVSDMLIRLDSVRGVATASDGSSPTPGGVDWTWRLALSVGDPVRELQVRVNRLGRSWICQPPPTRRYVECQ